MLTPSFGFFRAVDTECVSVRRGLRPRDRDRDPDMSSGAGTGTETGAGAGAETEAETGTGTAMGQRQGQNQEKDRGSSAGERCEFEVGRTDLRERGFERLDPPGKSDTAKPDTVSPVRARTRNYVTICVFGNRLVGCRVLPLIFALDEPGS